MKLTFIIVFTLALSSCGALKLASGLIGGTSSDKSIAKGAQVRVAGTHTDTKKVSLGPSLESYGNQGTQSNRDSITHHGKVGTINNTHGLPWYVWIIIGWFIPSVMEWIRWIRLLFKNKNN